MKVRLWFWLTWLLIGASCFYNLPNYPTLWWDEAIFSETAANLAQNGRYAFTVEGPAQLRDFDFRISAGPTLILPVALAYKVGGVSVGSGRLVAGGFLFLLLLLLYLTCRLFFTQGQALLAVILVLLTTDILYWGRSVMGDIPALALFLAGLYSLLLALAKPEAPQARLWFGGGLCLGLAICAKEFYGLAVFPPLVLLARSEWGRWRRLGAKIAALVLGVGLPLTAYLLFKAATLGGLVEAVRHFYIQKKLLCHEFFTPLTIGRLYPESWGYLLTHPLFVLGLLGWLLAGRRQVDKRLRQLWLLYLAMWSGFYLVAVYWQRFALPALVLASPGAAYLLGRLGQLLGDSWKPSPLSAWAKGGLILVLFLTLFPLPGVDAWREILQRRTDSPYKLAEALQNQIPSHMTIETPEYEVIFLDDEHRIHLMPEFYFVEADRQKVVIQSPDCESYDFLQVRADLLILGSFGKSIFRQNYPEETVSKYYRKIGSIDYYDLYLRHDYPYPLQVKLP